MLAKNITGVIILMLNTAGLCFVLYLVSQTLISHFFPKHDTDEDGQTANPMHKTEKVVIDKNIIPEEDDLLKDMDLSDLDNLNIDDFE